jgi:hypothetical protein
MDEYMRSAPQRCSGVGVTGRELYKQDRKRRRGSWSEPMDPDYVSHGGQGSNSRNCASAQETTQLRTLCLDDSWAQSDGARNAGGELMRPGLRSRDSSSAENLDDREAARGPSARKPEKEAEKRGQGDGPAERRRNIDIG